MYGLYLHADEERINRLKKTDEGLRFVCVRKYVEELENAIDIDKEIKIKVRDLYNRYKNVNFGI